MTTPPWSLVQYRTAGDAADDPAGPTSLGISVDGEVRQPPAALGGLTLMQVLDS